jgi:glycosyltransferase involved in cell wall biosynthesis
VRRIAGPSKGATGLRPWYGRAPMRVLVVVPAFNEERSLPLLLREIRELPRRGGFRLSTGSGVKDAGIPGENIEVAAERVEVEVVVIDDASRDRTARVARESGVRVVRLCRNLGIGGAVQTGLKLAQREGFDCAVQMDGDGQHPPSELGKLVAARSDEPAPDIVIGSRYLEREGFQSTLLRRIGISWLRILLGIVIGSRTTDPTSGYRLYGPRALRLFAQYYPYDYPEPEALVLAKSARLRVVEVPVVMRERQGGESSIKHLLAPYYLLKVTLAVLLAFVRSVHRPTPIPE